MLDPMYLVQDNVGLAKPKIVGLGSQPSLRYVGLTVNQTTTCLKEWLTSSIGRVQGNDHPPLGPWKDQENDHPLLGILP